MTTLLCASPYCGLPGQHAETVDDDHDEATCRGCLPARAADGLYLCGRCAGLLSRDALNAARLWASLGHTLVGGTGSRGPGGGDSDIQLNEAGMEARNAIRRTLVALCRLVAEERGFTLPDDTVLDMARYVCRYAGWLAAHQAAGEHAADLRDLVTDGRTWSVAYPTSGDRTLIGVCNQQCGEEPCGTPLWHREGEATLTCPSCGAYGSVPWWRWEMCSAGEREGIVDAYAAAAYLSWRWDRAVDAGLVRKWGLRYDLTLRAVGPDGEEGDLLRDHQQRVLFVLAELEARAARLWGEAPETLARLGA